MINNAIEKIVNGQEIDLLIDYVIENLYKEGPISTTVLEITTYLKIFQSEKFNEIEDEILEIMGVFYKEVEITSLKGQIFKIYEDYIFSVFGKNYTPLQASIIKKIRENQIFSFSAPTSTGKSFTFRYLVENAEKDVVIVVPSRALINEYYDRLNDLFNDNKINILTFIEKINIKHTERNIFIITPERCRELFKQKELFDIELFLFDEAQLSNENSSRALYFDSIVRRIYGAYSSAKLVFAHPFIENPIAQIEKNHLIVESKESVTYRQKNVGQVFIAHQDNKFFFFGIDKSCMGNHKIEVPFDPIIKSILNGGSVLIYTTKTSIYNKEVFKLFKKYIKLCPAIDNLDALELIEEIKKYIGATNGESTDYISQMIELLKVGIVVHHGSMPLRARHILEKFTQKGFCKLCFATSTLEQGINMPFEVVYVNTFEESEPLGIKNLIGRAGRSTSNKAFDYGYVIVKSSNMSSLRKVMQKAEYLDNISTLEKNDSNEDYENFKKAIINGTFSDEYNLTNDEVNRLNEPNIENVIEFILANLFENGTLISLNKINDDVRSQPEIYRGFELLYEQYLGGRKLTDGEKYVLDTAIKIMIWQIHHKNFKMICNFRYAFATQQSERRKFEKIIKKSTDQLIIDLCTEKIKNLEAHFFTGYSDLPNKNLRAFSLLGYTKAISVDYDRIVFDTYDFLDKLIGFKLCDIFYAVFYQYYLKTKSILSLKMSKYVKYGTDDDKEIWILKYGFVFEDMEWLKPCISKIDENEIVFNDNIKNLNEIQLDLIKRYNHNIAI